MQIFQQHALQGPYRTKKAAYSDLGCLVFFLILLCLLVIVAALTQQLERRCLTRCVGSFDICEARCVTEARRP